MTNPERIEGRARVALTRTRGVGCRRKRLSQVWAAATIGIVLVGPSVAVAQFRGAATIADVSSDGAQGDESASTPSVSADGRWVAFASGASNLVPLDTNGDTDVFVHDTQTGFTERVSVTWQGQEARDDSRDPSISADGRYVAFLSRAWNMYPGGVHVPYPRWQVYVHDRAGQSTIRLTVPPGGGEPNGRSRDPQISADGTRVVFASAATNLLPEPVADQYRVYVYDLRTSDLTLASVAGAAGSDNDFGSEPTISADGSVVAYVAHAFRVAGRRLRDAVVVRDLDAGTSELASIAFSHPAVRPDGDSWSPNLSDDGRFVAFQSFATNLTSDPQSRDHGQLYVRDRATGTTTLVSRPRLVQGPCGSPGAPEPCTHEGSDLPVLSGDGRFLAFLSASRSFLPANATDDSEQIYLLDRTTGRLRRLSVDDTGIAAGPTCEGQRDVVALSGDGKVLAYHFEDIAKVGLPDANGPETQHIVHLNWTCDDDGKCRSLSLCPPQPKSCEAANDSTVRIRRRPPGGSVKDHFYWRWSGAVQGVGTRFVDPTVSGHYHVCLYGGSPIAVEFDAGLPPEKGWTSHRASYRRGAKDDPVSMVKLRRGQARSTIVVKGSGPALDLPYLPLAAPDGITVQLHESTTGRCWGASFPNTSISANFAGAPGSGGRQAGRLRADVPGGGVL